MDPYKILDLPREFTLDQLRTRYKTIAFKVHPDKPGGSDYLFKLVTTAYKQLAKEHDARSSDKPFYDLRKVSRTKQSVDATSSGTSSFNIKRFNAIFDDNKVPDTAENGYKEWMATNAPPTSTKVSGKFNLDTFNTNFDSQPVDKNAQSVVKYTEPAPMFSSASKVVCSELGIENVSDYSGDSQKGLAFTDYKLAHTTSRLVSNDMVKKSRREYDNLDSLEKDRSSVRYAMNDNEMKAHEDSVRKQELAEKKRLQAVKKRDALVEQQYRQLSTLMGNVR